MSLDIISKNKLNFICIFCYNFSIDNIKNQRFVSNQGLEESPMERNIQR